MISALEEGETSIFCGATIMFRAELLKAYGGYRVFYDRIGAEHMDYFWRMLGSEKFLNLNRCLYTYYANPNASTQEVHNNPLKFYGTKLALLAYWQRKTKGTDFLESSQETDKIVKEVCQPHMDDPSLTLNTLATMQLAFGNLRRFVDLLKDAILTYGLTLTSVKTLLSAGPLVVFCLFVPKNFQRLMVKKSNRKFLKKYGIDLRSN